MPANAGLPDEARRLSLVCNCGKKLVAIRFLSLNRQHFGRRTTKAQALFVGKSHILDG